MTEVDIGKDMSGEQPIPHYYGDAVRRLFLVAAIIALITLPFLVSRWPVHLYLLIPFILIMGALAAATNPRQPWVSTANLITSIIFLLVFEGHAILSVKNFGPSHIFFWIHQSLALLFLFALYLSLKTVRGMALRKTPPQL